MPIDRNRENISLVVIRVFPYEVDPSGGSCTQGGCMSEQPGEG